MILSWMAYVTLSACLCTIVGVCLETAFGRMLRQRRYLWLAVMLASVGTPLALPMYSEHRPALVQQPGAAQMQQLPQVQDAGQAAGETALPAYDWNSLVLTLWLSSSSALAILLMWTQRGLRRRTRAYRRTSVNGQSLLVSEHFGPAIVGFLRPVIVLPQWVLALDEKQRGLVLSHELEHQRSGDPVIAIIGLASVVMFPWNAPLWWQLSRLRLAIELDCDARVLAHSGADPLAYGKLLVAAHENAEQSRGFALALASRPSMLAQRVIALVSRGARVPAQASRSRVLGSLGVALTALTAFAFAPVPPLPVSFSAASRLPHAMVDSVAYANTMLPVLGIDSGSGSVRQQTMSPSASRVAVSGRISESSKMKGKSTRRPEGKGEGSPRQSSLRLSDVQGNSLTLGTGTAQYAYSDTVVAVQSVSAVGAQSANAQIGGAQISDAPMRAAPAGIIRSSPVDSGAMSAITQTNAGTFNAYGGRVGRGGSLTPRPTLIAAPVGKVIDRNGFMGAEVRPRRDTLPPSAR